MVREKIIGQEDKLVKLSKMLRENRLPHALLFFGPQGVGKRSVAEKILADFLCENKNSCGHCASCRALAAGAHGDYHLIEPEVTPAGKHIIKIDAIRNLQTELAEFPVISTGRAVLIDEADAMNETAMNALLKTLEEPPGTALFILVTSSVAAILPTIISRTTRISFGALSSRDIAAALVGDGVAESEADELALMADGSLGKARELARTDALELERTAGALMKNLPDLDMAGVWEKSAELEKLGRDKVGEWLRYFIFYLRDFFVRELTGADLATATGEEMTLFYHRPEEVGVKISSSAAYRMIRLAADTQKRLNANVALRLQIEAFLIRARDMAREV